VGYLGILSLGHGAFFALGGYAMGMYLMRQIGERGLCPSDAAGLHGIPQLRLFAVVRLDFDMAWFAFLTVLPQVRGSLRDHGSRQAGGQGRYRRPFRCPDQGAPDRFSVPAVVSLSSLST
jgi:hypothetical protein